MSSPTRSELPGSDIRPRPAPEASLTGDDILGGEVRPTDDTPTIITRNTPTPAGAPGDPTAGIRGRRLAHFELLEPIGVGGMAAVLRARDTQLDRVVALKILPPETSADEETVRRFHQEARSAAKLDHENIARVFFCGEDQRLHFIAFEFVEGENLRVLLDRRGRLPVGEAVHYMFQVAAGLAHAARRGVVHRDIKPSNIIITPNGRAKLVDMGLARCLEPRSDNDLTQSGVTLGTFDYISPEQALEPREADVRSDIYSLGCTFYHALTGRPPVPEGTAAKKLHHHKDVCPADPREYVPDLPVEVVQILDRMMAKNPRDRYQSPEELVHQLFAARKLGTFPESPEGFLTVEASLPTPPGSRPLLWAALAAVAVVVLVLVLDHTSAPPPPPGLRLGAADEPIDADVGPTTRATEKPPDNPPPIQVERPAASFTTYVAPNGKDQQPTASHLIDWLERNRGAARVKLRLAGDVDLAADMRSARGLPLAAREAVVIEPRDPGGRVTLRLSYDARSERSDGPPVALNIQARVSRIEGIRFLLDAHESPGLEMQALRLGEGTHRVARCEFIQVRPDLEHHTGGRRVASVVADAPARKRAEVVLSDCVFLGFREQKNSTPLLFEGGRAGGQDAVVRRGGGTLRVENCLIGPHDSVFRLEGGTTDEAAPLTVRDCSIVLPARQSAVFDLPTGASGRLQMTGSLVVRLPGEGKGESALLRQADDRPEGVVYRGQDNAYHDLDAFWVSGGDGREAGWTDFRRKLAAAADGGSRDESSRLLPAWPWQAPPAAFVRALENLNLIEAVAVHLKSASLRKSNRFAAEVVGVSAVLGKEWASPLPLLGRTEEPAVPRLLVVEEKGDDRPNGVYGRLDQAVEAARSGDVIVIRHHGEFKVRPVRNFKTGLGELTVRPARHFRPVLTLDKEFPEAEWSLFHIQSCKLLLDGLEFLLQPANDQSKVQTVVSLVGDGECVLRRCVVTLQKSGPTGLTMALATIGGADKVMKSDTPTPRTPDQGPRLALDRCFLRGEGDVLWTRATRPFALEIKDSFAALSGSLLNIDATPEAKRAPASQQVSLLLTRTTTYLGASIVRIKALKEIAGLVPVECRANNCLFVPSAEGLPLIQLDGPEGAAERALLRERFTWVLGNQNSYGVYAGLFLDDRNDMAPPAGMAKKMPDEETITLNVKPTKAPPAGTAFARMKSDQFTWDTTTSGSGATATDLPEPAGR